MIKIAIPKERRPFENRVAATPETVKKFIALGAEIVVEKGAGSAAAYEDSAYKEAGATLAKDFKETVSKADIVLKVQRPLSKGEGEVDELSLLPKESILIGMLAPLNFPETVALYAKGKLTSFALELIPRITRAQTMDVLSSQSNLAGYRAVLEGMLEFQKALPMMMTAAGTILPAKVLILGAGVAGLQAIATARRMGAVVSAFDVRKAAKEQVESLGATFIEVADKEEGETKGGYAKEMSKEYQARQAEKIKEAVKQNDIVVTTALIPGKPAPLLVTEDMVKAMKPGSIIVDMAVEAGGNCALSKLGKVVVKEGVKIVGHSNLASRLATDASALYARNIYNFLSPFIVDQNLSLNFEDEIIKASLLTKEGAEIFKKETSK